MLCKIVYLIFLLAFMFGSSSSDCDNVCNRPLIEPGRCRGRFIRYGYDGFECRKFIWGGCPDNGNNFDSLEECQMACETMNTIGPVLP